MKTFAVALTVATANAWGNRYGFGLTDVEHFVEGLLLGALKAEVPDVMTCIHDAQSVVGDVENAYNDFKQENFDSVLHGIEELGTLVEDLANTIHACAGDVKQIENLINMAKTFSNPISFAWHAGKDLLIHGVDIYHEINDAIIQYDASNYEGFGEDVGKAMAQVLIGAEQQERDLTSHIEAMFLH